MKRAIPIFFLALSGFISRAQTTVSLDSTVLEMTIVVDSAQLNGPWDLEWGFDNRLWLTDTRKIYAMDTATHALKTLHTSSSGNYLSIAVPKTLPSSGPVYVFAVWDTGRYYSQSGYAALHRFTYSSGLDSLISDTVIFSYPHAGEHVGGKVIIAADGKLMLTTADYAYSADTIGHVKGKILRLNTDGSIPAGNARADYTWTYGHRNPEGMVCLPDGKIFTSEHGQGGNDEINYIQKGKNYGWPAYDGTMCTNLFPDSCASSTFVYEHPQAIAGFPPGGIEYYNYPQIGEWKNAVLTGALGGGGDIAKFALNATHDQVQYNRHYPLVGLKRIRDICAAPDGSVYLIIYDRYMQSIDTAYHSQAHIIRLRNANYDPQSINTYTAQGFSITPNPAHDIIQVSMNDDDVRSATYQVANSLGQQILSGNLGNKISRIDIRTLPSGVYYISILSAYKAYHQTIIVNH